MAFEPGLQVLTLPGLSHNDTCQESIAWPEFQLPRLLSEYIAPALGAPHVYAPGCGRDSDHSPCGPPPEPHKRNLSQ
jgi:hypothetical protein